MKILTGDALEMLRTLPDESVHCCVTSPPYYGLRDYGIEGQIGLEATPAAYIDRLAQVFHEGHRVLRNDGTLWINIGDTYSTHAAGKCSNPMKTSSLAGVKTQETARELKVSLPYRNAELPEKNLLGIPWRLAFALQDDGWILRQDIIWQKLNPMPEPVMDRCSRAHEYIFLLSKSQKYFYDYEAIKQPVAESTIGRGRVDFGGRKGREYTPLQNDPNFRNGNEQWGRTFDYSVSCKNGVNRKSVWSFATKPYTGDHFACFPPELPRLCILAGCPEGGIVLDPFSGAGTTLLVASRLGRDGIGIELNPEYVEMSQRRIVDDAPLFNCEGQHNIRLHRSEKGGGENPLLPFGAVAAALSAR
jgi:DNA modification methylase